MNHDHAKMARQAAAPGSSTPNDAAQAYAILALADALNNIAGALTTRNSPQATCGALYNPMNPDYSCVLKPDHDGPCVDPDGDRYSA